MCLCGEPWSALEGPRGLKLCEEAKERERLIERESPRLGFCSKCLPTTETSVANAKTMISKFSKKVHI